jgi:uncharacterized membrane protein
MAEREQLESFVKHVASESWRLFLADPVLYVLAALLVMVLSVVSIGIAIGPLTVGFIGIILRRQQGQTASVGDVFGGFDKFFVSFATLFVIMVAVLVGTLLLVLPGLIVALFSCFALQAVALEGKGVFDAIGRSIDLVRANFLEAFILLILISVLHAVGSMVVFGGLVSFPLSMIATLVAYQRLAERVAVPQLGSPQTF